MRPTEPKEKHGEWPLLTRRIYTFSCSCNSLCFIFRCFGGSAAQLPAAIYSPPLRATYFAVPRYVESPSNAKWCPSIGACTLDQPVLCFAVSSSWCHSILFFFPLFLLFSRRTSTGPGVVWLPCHPLCLARPLWGSSLLLWTAVRCARLCATAPRRWPFMPPGMIPGITVYYLGDGAAGAAGAPRATKEG